MKFILGTKIDMTQVWSGGNAIAVTRVKVDPCYVSQVKTKEKDGYCAVQICGGVKKSKSILKPQQGHLKMMQVANEKARNNVRYVKEFRVSSEDLQENYNLGNEILLNIFEPGQTVDVIAISKGCGFQGVVKRHGFKGARKTHGTKDQVRMPGSIGATGPQRVFKGIRMGGRMGGDRITIKNTKIEQVDQDNNVILIKGAVPGSRNGLVIIKTVASAKK